MHRFRFLVYSGLTQAHPELILLIMNKENFWHGNVRQSDTRTLVTDYICAHTQNTVNYIIFCVTAAWDNLRIDVYGFATFCDWFFKEYPSYFVVPIRITGSAVLDAVNYTTARHLQKEI